MKKVNLFIALCCALALAGCSSGDGDSSSPTDDSTTLTGVVQSVGNGTVQVDNVMLDTSNAKVTIEGRDADDADLKPGMKVTADCDLHGDGTGTAHSIDYDDEIEGVVRANNIGDDGTGTLDVMGQTIVVDENTVVDGAASAADITVDMIVEVSATQNDQGDWVASRIEIEDEDSDDDAAGDGESGMEVTGTIDSLDKDNMTFQMGDMTVDYSGAEVEGMLDVGVMVHVETDQPMASTDTVIMAHEVEVKDHDDDDHGYMGSGDPAAGHAVYDTKCFACHGVDGTGGSAEEIRGEDAGDIMEAIADEIQMQGIQLTDTELEDLVAFLNTPVDGGAMPTDPAPTDPAPTDPAPTDPAPTDPAPTDPAPGPDGHALYDTNCAGCHGTAGSGGIINVPVVGFSAVAISDAIANFGAMQTPGLQALTQAEIDAIAAYLGTL